MRWVQAPFTLSGVKMSLLSYYMTLPSFKFPGGDTLRFSTLAGLSGSPVSSWQDYSQRPLTATQATGSRQPARDGGALTFTGSEHLVLPDTSGVDGAKVSFVLAFQPNSVTAGTNRGLLAKRNSASSEISWLLFFPTQGNLVFYQGTGSSYHGYTFHGLTTGTQVVALVFDSEAGHITLYDDNLAPGNLTGSESSVTEGVRSTRFPLAANTPLPDTTAPITIGALNSGSSGGWMGKIYEGAIIYPRALDASEARGAIKAIRAQHNINL
jgi:hypothetical protein